MVHELSYIKELLVNAEASVKSDASAATSYLFKDWFDRNAETYVLTELEGVAKLDWESSLKGTSGYSRFFMKFPRQKTRLIAACRKKGIEMLSVLPIKDRINLYVTPTDSYTDGKAIFIATEVFDYKEYTEAEQADVFFGIVAHEGSHKWLTDFEAANSRKTNKFTHFIVNTLEDERIEATLCRKFRGYAKFIVACKEFHFNVKYRKDKAKLSERVLTESQKVVEELLYFVRYPKNVDKDFVEKHLSLFLVIRHLAYEYPEDTEGIIDLAINIVNTLKIYFPTMDDKDKEPTTSDEDSESCDDKSGKKDGKKGGKGDGDSEPTELEDDDDEPEDADDFDESSILSDKDLEDMMGEFLKTLMNTVKETVEKMRDETSSELKETDYAAELIDEEVECGDNKTFFLPVTGEESTYKESYERVKESVATLRQVMIAQNRDFDYVLKGQKNGRLDTTKLAEAIQGVQTVYEQFGHVKSKKIVVGVLGDQSGSMSGAAIKYCRDTLVLFNEVARGNKDIRMYIYGHTADVKLRMATEIYVYRENQRETRNGIGSCHAESQNRDGIAILETAKRMRRLEPTGFIVLYVVSDGSPCAADYGGQSARKHTKECVEAAEKLGVYVISVPVEEIRSWEMFKHFLPVTPIKELPKVLGNHLKALVIKYGHK